MSAGLLEPRLPTEAERNLARESAEKLKRFRRRKKKPKNVTVQIDSDDEALIPIPVSAFCLLADMLVEMARGNAITLIPVHAELTTQQAANILNVSRPYLIGLLDAKKIPYHLVGSHRRIKLTDLIEYKHQIDAGRREAFRTITEDSQELGLEY
jgi:excisionase family DNA binding protein